jgi:uncharacterized protein YfaP (DUF2135 family)
MDSMFLHGFTSRLLWTLIVVAALSDPLLAAQDELGRVLQSGVAVSGALDADNVAQVYTYVFDNGATQEIELTATSEDGLALALLVTDSGGQAVGQAADSEGSGTVTLSAALSQPDTYYVTVLPAVGAETTEGTFSLTLEVIDEASTATSQVDTETQLLTTSGLQVTLSWDTTADMDLEIRDPIGGSLRWATPTVPSGGQFGANVHQGCAGAIDATPSEEATWLPGGIPTGSYEILVYYQQDCEETREALPFTVTVVVDGQELEPVEGTLEPNQVGITSFDITPDGEVTQGPTGVAQETILSAAGQAVLDNPTTITRGTVVQGQITSEQPFQAYSFTAETSDVVTVSMNATSGSLDPLLFLVDENGNLIDTNDDAAEGVTNSAIRDRLLVAGGTFTVVATRYGQEIGGTEGDYELTIAGPTADIPAEVLALNLPPGAIEVSLLWDTNADLQLLVRDPRGDAVYDDDPDIPSGGRIAAGGNVNCNVAAGGVPVSYVYWPEGRVPAGTYEVDVWYQNQCNDTRPVRFTLTIVVNDTVIHTDVVQPLPNERYLTSFTIGVDGQVTPSQGGIIGGSETLNFQAELDGAQELGSGETVTGSITPDNKFDVYVFEGQAEDVVTIGMEATSGTLDTVLYLLSPDGTELAQNDDAVPNETTDSLISNFTLPEDGQYIIIASHFGALFGGTTGVYSLTFQQVS